MGIISTIKNIFTPAPKQEVGLGSVYMTPSEAQKYSASAASQGVLTTTAYGTLQPVSTQPTTVSGGLQSSISRTTVSGGSGGTSGTSSFTIQIADPVTGKPGLVPIQSTQPTTQTQTLVSQFGSGKTSTPIPSLGSTFILSTPEARATQTAIYAPEELGRSNIQPFTTGLGFALFGRGFGERAKSVARFEAGPGVLFDPLRGIGVPKAFQPVSQSDIRVFETTRPFETGRKGTVTDQPLINIRNLTYGEFQTFKEVESGMDIGLAGFREDVKVLKLQERVAAEEEARVIGKYQPLVDTGTLDLQTAQAQAIEEFNIGFQERFGTERDVLAGQISRTRIKGLERTRGDIVAETGTFALQTGAIIGAFASGSPAIVAGVSAGFAGLGLRDIQRGATGDFTPKERAGLILGGTLQAGLGAYGIRYVIGTQSTSLLARQSQKEILRDLGQKEIRLRGVELAKTPEGSLFYLRGARGVEGGRGVQVIDMTAPTFRVGEAGLPRVVGGRATARTTIRDVISDVPLTVTEKFIIGARATRTGEVLRTGIGKIETGVLEMPTLGGRGFIMRKGSETFREFPLAGASRKVGDELRVLGIKPRKFKPLDLPVGETSFGLRIRGILEQAGRIRLLPDATGGVRILRPARITKTPLSRTFADTTQIQVQQTGAGLLPGLAKETLIESTRGAGQILKQQTRIVPTTTLSQDVTQQIRKYESLAPMLRQSILPQQMQQERAIGVLATGTGFRTGLRDGQALAVTQLQTPRLKQELKLAAPLTPRLRTPLTPILKTLPFRPGFALPPLPSLFLTGKPGRKLDLLGGFNPRYTPSLTAASFILRGKVPKRFLKGEVDPFGRRLIPDGKKRKRRTNLLGI